MPVRVSVVVPVYNPGPHLDDLVASLLRQSLPPADFEVLFCDDGSDASTRQRLAAATAGHPHLRVLELEHSGWPGHPRNVGLDAASGCYVFFCDHDDRFSDDGLERLCDYADAHGSDVVFGHVVGVGRALRLGTFQRDVPRAVLGVDPLLDLLTPHKLFRTAFVREQGIRFPEGRVRLEDHMFVMQAYLAARVISILAEHPCYYWTVRQDRPSASAGLIDPHPYFHHLRQVLDIVEEHCGSAELLDRLLPHWLGLKVLERVGGRPLLGYPTAHRAALLEAVHPLVEERFPVRLDTSLPFPLRLRSALLRAGRYEDLNTLAAVEAGMHGRAAAAVEWTRDGLLRVAVRAELTLDGGRPLAFRRDQAGCPPQMSRAVWQLPISIAPDVLTPAVLDAGADLAQDSIQLFLRDLSDEAVYPLAPPSPGSTATVTLDPRAARFGRGLPDRFELLVELRRAGWRRRLRLDQRADHVD